MLIDMIGVMPIRKRMPQMAFSGQMPYQLVKVALGVDIYEAQWFIYFDLCHMFRMLSDNISGSDIAGYLCHRVIEFLSDDYRISSFPFKNGHTNVFARYPELLQKPIDGF